MQQLTAQHIAGQVTEINLLDSLDGEWLKMPLAVMQGAGPATQTLAGILKVTNRATFVPVAEIAARARLPVKTARNHLATLANRGWIKNAGRGPRRTSTREISPRTTNAAREAYGVLPWWSCCQPRRGMPLTWAAKAVLSIVLAKLMSLKAKAEQKDDDLEGDELWEAIDDLELYGERFAFRLDSLQRDTGLSRESVVAAKRELHRRAIVTWTAGKRQDGGNDKHTLAPSRDFCVKVTQTGEGCCEVEF